MLNDGCKVDTTYSVVSVFGERLRNLIKNGGLTQVAFAEKIGVRQSQVSGWIQGRHGPTLSTLRRIRDALGCTWDELLG